MGVASHTATSIINALSFKAIKESEERYRLLADNVTDVIWILDIASLHFSYISPSVKLQQGFAPEELMELPLQDILTPESFKKAGETIAKGLLLEKRGAFDPMRSTILELEEYCKDGSTIWIEVTASFLRDFRCYP
jgi:PAS domain S-box-containing protein